MANLKIERLNMINKDRFGTVMKIVEYKDANNIIVEFQDENKGKRKTDYEHFKKGTVTNPYRRTVLGIGFMGEPDENYDYNKCKRILNTWNCMFHRCYDKKISDKFTTYLGCEVDERWHNFQNFKKWYEDNYYEVEGESMHLDKDILIKGNKVYGPDTCIFVPQYINTLFVASNHSRGHFPRGVCRNIAKGNKFYASCNIIDENGCRKQKHLGTFDDPIEAFMVYKEFKEKYIKTVADKYKDKIPDKLYKAMYAYKIEITD